MDTAIHVKLHGECWEVTREGGHGVLNRYASRRDALREAFTKARMDHSELVLWDEDGAVSERVPDGKLPADFVF